MMLPLLFATVDYLTVHRHQKTHSTMEDINDSVYDAIGLYWSQSRVKHILPAATLSVASALIFRSGSSPASTFICPAATATRHSTAVSRMAVLPLDFCVVYCTSCLLQASSSSRKTSLGGSLFLVGSAIMVSILCSLADPCF